MDNFISFILSSQVKVFPDSEFKNSIKKASVLKNEAISFSIAYKAQNTECLPISVSVECEEIDVSAYKVGFVPVTYVKSPLNEVAHEGKGAGLYPDILFERNAKPDFTKGDNFRLPFCEKNENNTLNATDIFQSVLITVNENEKVLNAGNYKLKVKISSLLSGEILAEHIVDLKVIDKLLPQNELMYTNWVHYDCISDIHSVEIYSEEYFSLLEKYFKNATKHKMNTILVPAFTPPLDTIIGGMRKNVQLVKIKKTPKGYEFDFSLLKRFITLAISCGFTYFEHTYLFTQWGAKHAPNIYAQIDSKEERIFGWDTIASGKEYKEFLEQYIPAFLEISKELGIDDRLFFHISDEPTPENEESYIGYEKVIKLCEDYFGKEINYATIPENEDEMIGFREKINKEIEKMGAF